MQSSCSTGTSRQMTNLACTTSPCSGRALGYHRLRGRARLLLLRELSDCLQACEIACAAQAVVRDVLLRRDVGTFTGSFTGAVATHSVLALKITPLRCGARWLAKRMPARVGLWSQQRGIVTAKSACALLQGTGRI